VSVLNEPRRAETPAAGGADIVYLPPAAQEGAVVRDRFARYGWPVIVATGVAAALRLIETRRILLCVIDLADDRSAISSIRLLRAQAPQLPLVAIVDPSNPASAGEALHAGTSDILPWPFEERDIAALVADARDRAADPAGVRSGVGPDAGLVANSPAMRVVRELVQAAATSDGAVLLVGEAGTGRERIARAIHDSGLRSRRPMVVVDCAAGTPPDVERRLFGSAARRGAAPRTDVSETLGAGSALIDARAGTLLLINVLEASARVQARLARLLRDGEAAVGDEGEVSDLDVRVVTAADTSVDAAVAGGRRRRGRLEGRSHSRLDVPPFRRRREDLPQLAVHLARDICAARGLAPKGFSRSALSLLAALPWRGNGRELAALLDTLVGSVSRSVIQLEDVLEHARLDGGGAHLEAGVTLRDARTRFERDCISAVLMRHHGRVGEAAKALGIQRTNLYRKVRQLNVARSLLSARK
jgi:DNA-binding NtrC family response regulator